MCPLSISSSFQNTAILLLAILGGRSKRGGCLVEASIRCYKCGATDERTIVGHQTNSTITIIPKCSNMEKNSESFVKDCQYSTMCLKTITVLRLQHKELITITRGCAAQKDIQQVFNNGQWHQKYSIQEVFEEGCMEEAGSSIATPTSKTHCYCRGDLCNSSRREEAPLLFVSGLTLLSYGLLQRILSIIPHFIVTAT